MMGFSEELHFTVQSKLYKVNHHHSAVPRVSSALLSMGNLAKAAAVM